MVSRANRQIKSYIKVWEQHTSLLIDSFLDVIFRRHTLQCLADVPDSLLRTEMQVGMVQYKYDVIFMNLLSISRIQNSIHTIMRGDYYVMILCAFSLYKNDETN